MEAQTSLYKCADSPELSSIKCTGAELRFLDRGFIFTKGVDLLFFMIVIY